MKSFFYDRRSTAFFVFTELSKNRNKLQLEGTIYIEYGE